MARKFRSNNRQRSTQPRSKRREIVFAHPAAVPHKRTPPTQFGKPFVLLEDEGKNTFEYARGAWVPYALSIAQCRVDYQVTELPQKVNGKTRYEIRLPLPTGL